LAEIYLCNVCSCQEVLRRNGRGQAKTRAAEEAEAAERMHDEQGGPCTVLQAVEQGWLHVLRRTLEEAAYARRLHPLRCIVTEVYLCLAWSWHEILRMETPGQAR
jgi:hypothetical protein